MIGLVGNSYSAITNGSAALHTVKEQNQNMSFVQMLNELQVSKKEPKSTLSSSQILQSGRLNGEFASGFENSFSSISDKNSLARGAAANSNNTHVQQKRIDRTSKLYEKSMELENYFVKQVLSSMRKTVSKGMGSDDFAGQMYQDMLYDEYSNTMTKNAGFGLADQIYLSLAEK